MKIAICSIIIKERIRKEILNIDALARDIKANGLICPIAVMQRDEGYQLLAGLRRLRAMEMNGETEIDVNVIPAADAEAAIRIEFSENEQREEFTYSEQMDYARLIEEIESVKSAERMSAGKKDSANNPTDHGPQGMRQETRNIVGAKIGMSGRQYDRAKYIAENASPEIIEQLDRGERTIRGTYDQLRAQEKASAPPDAKPDTAVAPPVQLQPQPRTHKGRSPMDLFSKKEIEVMRKLAEFNAMTPEGKIAELQRQLREERVRYGSIEDKLASVQNDLNHKNSLVDNLKKQLAEAHEIIRKLESPVHE